MAMFINKDAAIRHHHDYLMARIPPLSVSIISSVMNGLDLSISRNPFLTPPPYLSNHFQSSIGSPPENHKTTPPSSPTPPQTVFHPPSTSTNTRPLIAVDAIRESAAQLWFMNVNFLNNLTPFTQLPMSDQL